LQACRNTTSPECSKCSFRRRPARLPRNTLASVAFLAVQLQKVECIEEHVSGFVLVSQTLEHGNAVVIAADGLAVD
jgi:hypothetical protein